MFISFVQIIDPWGKIIAECPKYNESISTNESFAIAEIDNNLVSKIRRDMPVFQHRRDDIYSLKEISNSNSLANTNDREHYMFSDKVIERSTVFYSTEYSYAFTNIRCVVPGRILSCKRGDT